MSTIDKRNLTAEHGLTELLKAFTVTSEGIEFAYPPGTTIAQLADLDFEGFLSEWLSPQKQADYGVIRRAKL